MLIILGGLPASGKTTVARELARQLGAVHVRIDSIEQAIRASGVVARSIDDAGYRVGYAVAEDNLRLGRTVIADSVNPLSITRDAWVASARRAAVRAIEIEITCSDAAEHRRRVETRTTDVPGLPALSWRDVVARDYQPWDRERVVIDTAGQSVEHNVTTLRAAIASVRGAV
jgi:predicted kinase